jgi:hypothetical protein
MRLRSWQLAACRSMSDRRAKGRILNNLGELARSLGQKGEARGHFEQALAIFQAIGAVDSSRVVAENLAYLDADNTATGRAPETPAMPPEKAPPPRRRRWPWQRKRAN